MGIFYGVIENGESGRKEEEIRCFYWGNDFRISNELSPQRIFHI